MKNKWWKGCTIYQVYPRSFHDSNNDGIGDLRGIINKIHYIQSLGVDALWISPFYESPMDDYGYDVSNYYAVDPIFGTLEDFTELVATAHDAGLKILVDLVISHTSDKHAWFKESSSNLDNEKSDWYCWADPKEDGNPPNNWLSIFGGSAWTWCSNRGEYYYHNFISSQPKLNFQNPKVLEELDRIITFWLEKGVDGFRLDTANFLYFDSLLRNNPSKSKEELIKYRLQERAGDGVPRTNPYGYQKHVYDKTRPENVDYLKRLRTLLNKYPDKLILGELSSDDSFAEVGRYTSGNDKLHMAYTFELLCTPLDGDTLRSLFEYLENQIEDGWSCWSFSNHDVVRAVTRYATDDDLRDELSKLIITLLILLRGSIIIYQGEELGLMDAEVAYEDLQDPYGKPFWPDYKGRDGCRTPMPWQHDALQAGFSCSQPWLPVPLEYYQLAVNLQEENQDSCLNFTRNLLKFRSSCEALRIGDISFIESSKNHLVLVRDSGNQKIISVLNLSKNALIYRTDSYVTSKIVLCSSNCEVSKDNSVFINSYGFCLFEV